MTTTSNYTPRANGKPAPPMKSPHSLDAERMTIGAILRDGERRTDADLQAVDFYDLGHQHIWQAIQGVEAVDVFTVSEWLGRHGVLEKCGGDDYLMQLRDDARNAYNVAAYSTAVKRLAKRRRFIDAAQAIAQAAHREDLDEGAMLAECEKAYTRAASGITTARTKHISEVVQRVVASIEDLQANPGSAIAVRTGFGDVDKMLGGGAKKAELYIIAARPGMGKTSFLLSIIANNLKDKAHQKRGAIYTLEMGDESLVKRLISGETGIDSTRLGIGDIKTDEWGALMRAGGALSSSPVYINDAPMSIASITADARRLRAVYGIEYVMIDFLGLVDAPGDKEYQKVSNVALGAQALAKELQVPVFLACQLSRGVEDRGDKRPGLSDLRDSGRIEEAADVVVMLYRDEYYDPQTKFANMAEVLVRKNRNGPTGTAMLFFDKRLTAFKNLAKERIEL